MFPMIPVHSRPTRVRPVVGSLLAAIVLGGCGDDSPSGVGSLRFGQIGEARLSLQVPLLLGEGRLEQSLIWSSQGPFVLTERISYQGDEGGLVEDRHFENPDVLAGSYAQWIAQVNEVRAVDLFVEELDPDLDPVCGAGRTRLTLEIFDQARGETAMWTRCLIGGLSDLRPSDAGPDPQAARVASAAILFRDQSLGGGFRSAFSGSVPFATIVRGEDPRASLEESRVVESQFEWEAFWASHFPEAGDPPAIDFTQDLVVAGAVGLRQEAGDSVEIRRILPADATTVVTLVERVPGDFCSPAERLQTPFHVVRAPRVPLPVVFANVSVERVPCGL